MEYSVVTFPMNRQAEVTSVKAKEELIGQFLKNAVGMDPRQTRLAIRHLKSLLVTKKEPGKAHSWSKGAGYRETRMLRRSLCQLLNAVKEA